VIFITEAPYSPRMRVMVGPAMMRHSSRTLMPARGEVEAVEGRGMGGVVVSRGRISHGGRVRLVLPCVTRRRG
jgi:hypothetical protein